MMIRFRGAGERFISIIYDERKFKQLCHPPKSATGSPKFSRSAPDDDVDAGRDDMD